MTSYFTPEPFWEDRQLQDAARSAESRSIYDKDRSRIIHSPSFRRLQAKTQVLDITEGEYHRTRLTHSMEVSQIARGLVQQLLQDLQGREECGILPPIELIETVAFAHDIGHPPFGHNGEVALNYKMHDSGDESGTCPSDAPCGFEGNGQSLRILTKLERRPSGPGLNLTRRTLLGILKYPRSFSDAQRLDLPAPSRLSNGIVRQDDWKPPKCYLDTESAVVDWLLEPLATADREKFVAFSSEPTHAKHGKTAHKSLDCSLLDLADDIAYATHDLEDGVALGLVHRDQWKSVWEKTDREWRQTHFPANVTDLLFGEGWERREAVSKMIHAFIISVRLRHLQQFVSPILDCRADVEDAPRAALNLVKELTYERIIRSPAVQTLEYRGRNMIMKIYEALIGEPESLLTGPDRKLFLESRGDGVRQQRIICDFVAGMTDPYATRFYERLYVPRTGSSFDRL
ncbi:MAG: anti-phage deoxyguanosine triphosphatase [Armatimonadota bacterium]